MSKTVFSASSLLNPWKARSETVYSCFHKRLYSIPLCALVITLQIALQPAIADTHGANAFWSGGLFRFPGNRGLDYSVEYQARFDAEESSQDSQFGEFMGYRRYNEDLVLSGGYRFTSHTDHESHRVFFGGFWDVTPNKDHLPEVDLNPFKMVLQIGYQHDFNAKFDDELMNSDSIRYMLIASKPINNKVTPFLVGGLLTTWNSAYDFGIDTIRIGGGIVYKISKNGQIRVQYLLQNGRFKDDPSLTNIVWVRYEFLTG